MKIISKMVTDPLKLSIFVVFWIINFTFTMYAHFCVLEQLITLIKFIIIINIYSLTCCVVSLLAISTIFHFCSFLSLQTFPLACMFHLVCGLTQDFFSFSPFDFLHPHQVSKYFILIVFFSNQPERLHSFFPSLLGNICYS